MGMRHLVVVDGELGVAGLITRSDMNEHRLSHYWEEEGEALSNELKVDTLPTAIVYEAKEKSGTDGLGGGGGGGHGRSRSGTVQSDHSGTQQGGETEVDPEIHEGYLEVSDSPPVTLRKKLSERNA